MYAKKTHSYAFYANTVYCKGDYDKYFTGRLSGARRNFELEEEAWAIKYGVGCQLGPWNLNENPVPQILTAYPWVGAFFFHDDWTVNVSPAGEFFDGVNEEGTLDFNTPMVGLTARWKITERWYMNLSYGYGGWGVSDVDEIYDFLGNVAYRFKMGDVSSRVFAGYRYLRIDYEKQPVTLKVDVKGPSLALAGSFDGRNQIFVRELAIAPTLTYIGDP